jgi:hypothetical protein
MSVNQTTLWNGEAAHPRTRKGSYFPAFLEPRVFPHFSLQSVLTMDHDLARKAHFLTRLWITRFFNVASCVRSVDDLKHAINRFIAETNCNPKPFTRTADPRRVLAAIKRGKDALETRPSSLKRRWCAELA